MCVSTLRSARCRRGDRGVGVPLGDRESTSSLRSMRTASGSSRRVGASRGPTTSGSSADPPSATRRTRSTRCSTGSRSRRTPRANGPRDDQPRHRHRDNASKVYATVARHVRTDPEPDRGAALAGEVQRVCLSWIRARRRCVDHDATYLLSAGRCYATGLMTDAATGVPVKVVRQLHMPYRSRQGEWTPSTSNSTCRGRSARGRPNLVISDMILWWCTHEVGFMTYCHSSSAPTRPGRRQSSEQG